MPGRWIAVFVTAFGTNVPTPPAGTATSRPRCGETANSACWEGEPPCRIGELPRQTGCAVRFGRAATPAIVRAITANRKSWAGRWAYQYARPASPCGVNVTRWT